MEGRRVLDLLADRGDLHLDELAELSSGDRALTTGPHRDQRADLLQAQPEPFGASDELQPRLDAPVVDPVTGLRALRRIQQPDLLVVPQRRAAEARALGQLSDP